MNRTSRGLLLMASTLLIASSALAAEPAEETMPEMTAEQMAEMEAYMRAGTPGEPHERLASETGTFEAKVKSWHEPDGPPMEETGSAKRTMILDGRVMMEEFSGTMMGTPFTGIGMTGYDNVTGKYWSTWMDSMSTGMMASEGTCDAEGSCTFTGSWNDPIRKGPVTVRMITRWTSPTTQVFEMHGPGKDGKEMKMMEMTYTKR